MIHEALTILINSLLTASEEELEMVKRSGNNQQDWIVHMVTSTILSRLAGSYIEVRKALK